jgi:hypothetical protein
MMENNVNMQKQSKIKVLYINNLIRKTMKNLIMIFAVVVIMAGFTTKVLAQATDTKSNDANAQILGTIALTTVTPLDFGSMTPSTGGTVIVTYGGSRTQSGAVVLVAGITPTAASYTVTGTGLATYAITIPSASFDITNTTGAGAETMAVTAMGCSYAGLTSAFIADGTDAFTVGATLTVASAQVAGVYTGTFDVTVAYN